MGYDTMAASVRDSKRGAELVGNKNNAGETFWLDADDTGTDDNFIRRGITPIICEKGFRGHPLNDEHRRKTVQHRRYAVAWNTCSDLLSVR